MANQDEPTPVPGWTDEPIAAAPRVRRSDIFESTSFKAVAHVVDWQLSIKEEGADHDDADSALEEGDK